MGYDNNINGNDRYNKNKNKNKDKIILILKTLSLSIRYFTQSALNRNKALNKFILLLTDNIKYLNK